MDENILVPFDGTDTSIQGLEYTLEYFSNHTITALYVVSVPEGYWTAFETDPEELSITESMSEKGQAVLDEAGEIAEAYDQAIETDMVIGVPADQIVKRAEEDDTDLIVIGSHGREGLSHTLLGSVAEKVVRRAHIPVLVVK